MTIRFSVDEDSKVAARLRPALLQTPYVTPWGMVYHGDLRLDNLKLSTMPSGLPKIVAQCFDVCNNPNLSALEGAPAVLVDSDSAMFGSTKILDISDTSISTLDNAPENITHLIAYRAPLSSLAECPASVIGIYLDGCTGITTLCDAVNSANIQHLSVVGTKINDFTDFCARFPSMKRLKLHVHRETVGLFGLLTAPSSITLELVKLSIGSPVPLRSFVTAGMRSDALLSDEQLLTLQHLEQQRQSGEIFSRRGRLSAIRRLSECGLEHLVRS